MGTATVTRTSKQQLNRYIKQNNKFARASRFFVHFFAVTVVISSFIEDVNKRGRNFHSVSLNLSDNNDDKV